MPVRLTLLLVALLGPASTLHAHEFWLAPSDYRPAPGDTLAVTAYVGTGLRGELKPVTLARIVRLELLGAQRAELAGLVADGAASFARMTLPDAGGALVAYESNFAHLELPGPEFDAYLQSEGLEHIVLLRRRGAAQELPGTEKYRRCVKTWVAGNDTTRAFQVVGMPLELIPEADPATARHLPVVVLWRDEPLPGARLQAWRQPLRRRGPALIPLNAAERDSVPARFVGRTDSRGRITVPVDVPGEWMLSVVHMVPGSEPRADWESAWASLTFAHFPE